MVPLTGNGQSPRGSGGFSSDSVILKKYKKIKNIFFIFILFYWKSENPSERFPTAVSKYYPTSDREAAGGLYLVLWYKRVL